mmetsp:Transcript_8965/g.55135  ORF Transcript_8965/g.55135 Transcript_8965/m.55135 type:complete len:99 (+) Transcript_8965:811-1107(+)
MLRTTMLKGMKIEILLCPFQVRINVQQIQTEWSKLGNQRRKMGQTRISIFLMQHAAATASPLYACVTSLSTRKKYSPSLTNGDNFTALKFFLQETFQQ